MLPGAEERSICLLGDILISDHLGSSSKKITSLLNKTDIVLGNLETTFATSGYPAAKRFRLRADCSIVKDLRELNVKALTLANNHTMDFGFEGLFETMEVLEKHGIAYTGAGHNLAEALEPAILKLGDLRIAFLACSSHVTSNSIAGEDRPGIAPLRVNFQINITSREQQEYVGGYPEIITRADESDLNTLLIAVANAKRENDILVVSIHWGLMWQPMIFNYQTEVAHTLIDNGADIIMGHGPHVLHGIEVYKNRYIFYSLGHFVFHLNQPGIAPVLAKLPDTYRMNRAIADPARWRTRETAIGKVMLLGSEIKRSDVIPVILDRNGSPRLCDNEQAMSILNYLRVISRYLSTSVAIRENGGSARYGGILEA